MISLGIFIGYSPNTLEESIRTIKALDFKVVQLDLAFTDGMKEVHSQSLKEKLNRTILPETNAIRKIKLWS